MKRFTQRLLYDFRWFIVASAVIATLPYTLPSGAIGIFVVIFLPYLLIRGESRKRFRENGYQNTYFPQDLFSETVDNPPAPLPVEKFPVPINPHGPVECVFENAHKVLIRQNNNGKFYAVDDRTMHPISNNAFTFPIQAKWEIMRTYPNALIIEEY